MAGLGKTALIKKWFDDLAFDHLHGGKVAYIWSFDFQDTAADKFFEAALSRFQIQG